MVEAARSAFYGGPPSTSTPEAVAFWRRVLEAAQAVAPPKASADALEAVRATLTEIADDFESGVAVMPHDVAVVVARLIREWRDHERPSSPTTPATPSLLDQPTPTAYRHKNQLTGQWIYTESRCPSEWAERDGIVQEPLYLSGAAPATEEPTPWEADRVWCEALIANLSFWSPEFKAIIDYVVSKRPNANVSSVASSPSGASGTEEGKLAKLGALALWMTNLSPECSEALLVDVLTDILTRGVLAREAYRKIAFGDHKVREG